MQASRSWRTPMPLLTRPCLLLLLSLLTGLLSPAGLRADEKQPAGRRFLYVAAPGIRNYLEFGGAGILVFDVERGHTFVKRIATPASRQAKPENIKGICACAATQ